VAALSLGSLTAASAAGAFGIQTEVKPQPLPNTVAFIKQNFGAVDIETRMTTGFAIEAFAQLAGAGLTASDLSPSVVREFTSSFQAFRFDSQARFFDGRCFFHVEAWAFWQVSLC
jgi:hypothetical protein